MSKFPRRRGFTLIELLIVIVVIAILALIVIPKLMGASRKAKDSTLKANLVILRHAVEMFQADCGVYPVTGDNGLTDLTVVDPATLTTSVPAGTYKGPYLSSQGGITTNPSIPRNPYVGAGGEIVAHWIYTNTSGVTTIVPAAPAPIATTTDANGDFYSTY